MKRTILAGLTTVAIIATAALPAAALNERFQESREGIMNKLNDRFKESREEVMNKLNDRFKESREEIMNK